MINFAYSNKNNLLINKSRTNYGIKKLGPCTAQLDDNRIIDLRELLQFYIIKKTLILFNL